MGKNTDYAIDEYRIVDGRNAEIKAHVRARFDGILRTVDFWNPEPSDPAGKLRADLEDLRKVQRKFPDANLQPQIERLEKRISDLEG